MVMMVVVVMIVVMVVVVMVVMIVMMVVVVMVVVVMTPLPELFAGEETVLGARCLAQVSPGSRDRGQAVCLELGALDHTS